MFWVIVIITSFWLLLYVYFTRNFNHWKTKNVPYVPPLPFFGNVLEVFTFKKSIGQACRQLYQSTTKPFLGFFICDEPALLICDLDLVKTILIKDFNVFSDHTTVQNLKADSIGSNLLFFLKNPQWRDMRKKLSPFFSTSKLKLMYQLIKIIGEQLVRYLEREVAKDDVVDVRETFGRYTTDTISSTAFGIDASCFTDESSEFRAVSRRVLNLDYLGRAISIGSYFVAPNLVQFFKLRFVDKESANFLTNVFWKMMAERKKHKVSRNDLLDIMIEIKKDENVDDVHKLEDDMLLAQAVQFFLAGFETTSGGLIFTLYELALHPEIQSKARKEVLEIINKHGDLSFDAIREMEYLELCFKEGLRKYPILSFLDRRCNKDYVIPGTDVVLEKGTPVFIPSWGLHMDEKYFPDPHKFDPLRFTEENIKSRPQFTYMPFGEGPRSCIGARYAVVNSISALAHVLSRFEVEICDKTQCPVTVAPKGFLLSPVGEVYLRFRKI